jgi:hypothetical protein
MFVAGDIFRKLSATCNMSGEMTKPSLPWPQVQNIQQNEKCQCNPLEFDAFDDQKFP